jgi:heme/copper-type cytochrome/quinol oxidase subunit 4
MSTGQIQGSTGKYFVVYAAMLVLSLLEVLTVYRHPAEPQLLVTMLLLAFAGGVLCVLYFMGLAVENHSSKIGFALYTLFVLAAMTYGWTDSFRILHGAPFAK